MRSPQLPAVRSSEPPVRPPAWPSADHAVCAGRADRFTVMSARRLETGGLCPRVGGIVEGPVADQRRLRRAGQGQAKARRRGQRPDCADWKAALAWTPSGQRRSDELCDV